MGFPSWDGAPSPPPLSLFSSFIFFPSSFEDNGLLFWVPDVLCQHSEVVLWSLLSVEMFFWGICEGESGLPLLFLRHFRTAPKSYYLVRNRQCEGCRYHSLNCSVNYAAHTNTSWDCVCNFMTGQFISKCVCNGKQGYDTELIHEINVLRKKL